METHGHGVSGLKRGECERSLMNTALFVLSSRHVFTVGCRPERGGPVSITATDKDESRPTVLISVLTDSPHTWAVIYSMSHSQMIGRGWIVKLEQFDFFFWSVTQKL